MFIPNTNVKSLLGLSGHFGDIAADIVMAVTGIHKMNRTFSPLDKMEGIGFAQASLDLLQVNPLVSDDDLRNIPQTGPCIICSNHPYGCLDGLAMLATVGRVRKDVRIMTNYILSTIPCLSDHFLSVDPFSTGKPKSVNGVRASLDHLSGGGCLVLFPAGEVSSDRNPRHVVMDIDWQPGAMRLIKKAGVPVIPAYFSGCNSRFFHILGAIHPRLRTIRLPRELLNKRGHQLSLKFGKQVKPVEFASYKTPEELGAYLRNRTYFLEGLLHGEAHQIVLQSPSPVEAHIAPSILKEELSSQEKNILYREGCYVCYLTRYEEIPNMMHEIGVCREETFRKNNEGTGKAVDTDQYDKYYRQMFLWNEESCELVGAYRIGIGSEIIEKYGIRGFYSDLFFHFKDEIEPLLKSTIELGRSFIVEKYQTVPNTLKMLLNNGIGTALQKFPDMKYFMGPASISSNYPKLFSSLIVEYLKRTRIDWQYADMVEPDIPFVPEFQNVDIEAIGLKNMTIDSFDKALSRFSGNRFRLPPLIRAYSKANCTYLGFNVDPDFNYCVDSLVLTAIGDIPDGQVPA